MTTTYVYPDEIFIEGNFSGDGVTWDRITDVIQGSEEGRWGIFETGVQDRMAGTDWFKFQVRNDAKCSGGLAGYYTPGHPNVRVGWAAGLRVRFGVTFENFTKYFHGRIPKGGIKVDPNAFGPQRVDVRGHGFGEQLANHELDLISYVTNVNVVEVAQLILANMDVQPLATEYGVAQKTFAAAFDTLRSGDKALQELAKAVIAEWGYAYVKRDRTVGETFTVEGAYTRSSITELSKIPLSRANSGRLLKENGGYLLKEDGGKIILNQVEEANMGNTMLLDSPETEDGGDLVNYARAVVYPREVRENITLFTLQKPIFLSLGEERTDIRGGYRDPAGGNAQVSGKNVTTMATMNSQEDFLGTDLSAYLAVTAVHGTAEVEYQSIRNNHPSLGGYVLLEAIGDGMFIYDAVDRKAEDATSIAQHGRYQEDIALHYLENPLVGQSYAEYVVSKNKDVRMRARSTRFLANTSGKHMLAFIFLDIASRFYQEQERSNVAGDFFIQGVQFKVAPGGLLYYRWYTKEVEDEEYWELGVSALEVDNALAFG